MIANAFRFYAEVAGFDDFLAKVGAGTLRDATQLPVYQQMELMDPLPPGFTRKTFHFRDERFGKGDLEVVFKEERLVNLRPQLFLRGFFGISKAKKFLRRNLVPLMETIFGAALERSSSHFVFRKSGIYGTARWVPGSPSVSTGLIDEEFK